MPETQKRNPMTQDEFNQRTLHGIECLESKFDAKFDKLTYPLFGIGVGIIMALIGIIALFIRG